MKNKYTILGVVLVFIASFLLFGSFSFGFTNGNILYKIGYVVIFIIGVICVRKGKEK